MCIHEQTAAASHTPHPRSFVSAIAHVFAVLVSDEVLFSCSICHRQYGPLSVHARCYERSIPAPTLSVEGGHASSLPTMLRINLRSVLASSEFDATLTMEMIDKDEFGTVETFLVLDSVPFDMIPLAFIQVGTPPLVEVMQVAAVNATTSVTVIRAMRQTKMLVHPVGSPVKVLDISRCDALRQANRTNGERVLRLSARPANNAH